MKSDVVARDGLPIAKGEMLYDLSTQSMGWVKVLELQGSRPDERGFVVVDLLNGYADMIPPYFLSHTKPEK